MVTTLLEVILLNRSEEVLYLQMGLSISIFSFLSQMMRLVIIAEYKSETLISLFMMEFMTSLKVQAI